MLKIIFTMSLDSRICYIGYFDLCPYGTPGIALQNFAQTSLSVDPYSRYFWILAAD
jgi:hypothetical protein